MQSSFVQALENQSLALAIIGAKIGVVILIAFLLLRWKKIVQKNLLRHKGKHSFDPLSLEIGGRIFTLAILFFTVLILLQLFGVNTAPLIAFGGVGAAALGFASKDVIANFFGGVMISLTRPFAVGDLVELPQKQMSGHVEEIGWYLTSLRDLEKQPIYVPNWLFATEMLINQSRRSHRCLNETVAIEYEDIERVSSIVKEVKHYLEERSIVDRELPFYFHLINFSSSALQFELKAYLYTTRQEEFMAEREKILLGIAQILSKLGARLATPSTAVLLKNS